MDYLLGLLWGWAVLSYLGFIKGGEGREGREGGNSCASAGGSGERVCLGRGGAGCSSMGEFSNKAGLSVVLVLSLWRLEGW